ncbi:MAG: glycosyltransferase [Bryobacteraceae bacterium]
MATHIFTSAAANYVPKARVLAQSVRKFHPDWKIHLVLCDQPPPGFADPDHFDSIWTLEDLAIPNLKSWLFQHTLVEASTGVKGFALRKLLSLPDCDHVLYFDPDIVLLSSLQQLLNEFERGSILLTPHITETEKTRQAIADNELNALQYGIYNLGFVGVKNSPEGNRFASWWCDRLQDFCFDDRPRGLFTDQRWADLVPPCFPEHVILRDPTYNVCTWNLTHRTVTGSVSAGLLVNGRPIGFYHFSGFDSGSQQGMLDRYGSEMPALYELREWYSNACENADQEGFSGLPWAYDFFDNGERILRNHRERYRESASLQALFPDPFRVGEGTDTYLGWLNLHDQPGNPTPPAEVSDDNPIPDYRIVVIATRQDAAFAIDTCRRIVQSSYQRSEFVLLLGDGASLDGNLPPEFQVITEAAASYSTLFHTALQRWGEKDLILIRAGAVPSPFWDLRLAWSAARQAGALSVAPLDRRLLDPSAVLGKFDHETLDCLAYWYRPPSDIETVTLEGDCVYIRAAALADISGSRIPANVSDLLAQSTRLRYTNFIAAHVCLGWNVPRQDLDALDISRASGWSIRELRHGIRAHQGDGDACPIHTVMPGTLPTLHVSHSWGGGIDRWLAEYADADQVNENLVLKAHGPQGRYGTELRLYRYGRLGTIPEVLGTWQLKPAVKATDTRNPSYQAVLREIFREYRIGKVLVSSLIGHSLECLKQPVPTVFICHDYYPFCAAINLTFGEVCASCEVPRLRACLEENPLNRSFPNVPVPEWLSIRSEFVRTLNENAVPLIAPSPSVKENYSRALPEVGHLFRVIPHGVRRPACATGELSLEAGKPLRVLVLGSMALHKGRLLLEALLPELLQFAEVTLAGCFDFPDRFLSNPRIHVIPSYDREGLCRLIQELQPEAGLLLSIFPETFSYTLHELQSMGVPPVATRIGSFEDWIKDGETGFLADPQPAPLLDLLRSLASDRSRLQRAQSTLKTLTFRSPEQMVSDYRELSGTFYSAQRYFEGPSAPPPLKDRSLQLYWRTGEEGFSEQNSAVVLPRGSSRQTLRLDFATPGRAPTQLRLDLATRPGFVLLHQVTLSGRNEESLWLMDCNSNGLHGAEFVQCFVVNEPTRGENGVLLCLLGDDPHIFLPIPQSALNESRGAGTLAVEFTPEPDIQNLGRTPKGTDNALAALHFGTQELTSALARARDEALTAQLRTAEVERDLQQELARARDEALTAQLRTAEVERNLQQELARARDEALTAQMRTAETEQDLQQALLRARDEASAAQLRAAQLERNVQHVRTELAHREQIIEGVQRSVSWKITRPLRTLAQAARREKNNDGDTQH